MHIGNPSKKVENIIKGFALLLGILCGSLYASFSRSDSEQGLFFSRKPISTLPTSQPNDEKAELNETAQFLVPDDTTLADSLEKAITVLCWIHVDTVVKANIDAIKNTWGSHCTSFIVISNSGKNQSNIFIIPKEQDPISNIKSVYRFIYENYGDAFDWFLRTDDKLYVVMENLRYKLYAFDPLEPIGFGLTIKNANNQVFFSENAGYVLSKSAVKNLVNGFENGLKCVKDGVNLSREVRFGQCLKEVGVIFGKSTDDHGKQLFFDKYLDDYFLPKVEVRLPYPWYQDYKVEHFLNSASNFSITFYGMNSQRMYVMEYLIYDLRPYGLETITPPLPAKMSLINL